jgi:dihydroorotate dehydrogenase (fumarate)
MDISVRYLGLELVSPLVASSSPLTGDLDGLRALEDAGAGAVVLPSLFEEQLSSEAHEVDQLLCTGAESFGEALSYFPEQEDYRLGADQYLELIRAGKQALDIPVIGSLNGFTVGGWLEHAGLIQQAGADALELNVYTVAADPAVGSQELEARLRELVRAVRDSVEIPVAVKLSPYFTAFAHTATELVACGADGLVLFNRFYQPDLDLDTLEVKPHLVLSRSEEMRLPLRWIAILHDRLDASLAATTGVHSADDVLKLLLAGADVAMLASALLERGPSHLSRVERDLREWLGEREYASVSQLRGSVSRASSEDPEAYERANYMKTLRSYSSPRGV